jgi:membrane fusion protein (multidrug efflux system)
MRAQADARKAELDLDRARELKQANAVPQERLDNAQVAKDTAQAQLEQAKANLVSAEETRRQASARVEEARGRLSQSMPVNAQQRSAQAQAELAHARVKSAEAQLELARLQFSYTRITAPADGVASKLTAHVGQLIRAAGRRAGAVGHLRAGQFQRDADREDEAGPARDHPRRRVSRA